MSRRRRPSPRCCIVGIGSHALAYAVRVHVGPDRRRDRRSTRRGLRRRLSSRAGAGWSEESEYLVLKWTTWSAELQAMPEEALRVGNGAILYRREIEELGSRVRVASPAAAHPDAAALVELAVPRFLRRIGRSMSFPCT